MGREHGTIHQALRARGSPVSSGPHAAGLRNLCSPPEPGWDLWVQARPGQVEKVTLAARDPRGREQEEQSGGRPPPGPAYLRTTAAWRE